MSDIYFTSDTHLGHKNIAGKAVSKWGDGYRTFNSVDEMDDILIKNINDMVKEDDILYHLGDFSFGSITKYRERINCKNIHLVLGNHDRVALGCKLFTSVNSTLDLQIGDNEFFLSHYAHRVWNRSHRGTIHLYGHSHSSIDNNWGKSMDVGVDMIFKMFNEYSPIGVNEILTIMENRKVLSIDHHDTRP